MIKRANQAKKTNRNPFSNLKPLQRLSLFFFRRPRKTALLALVIVLFGIISFTSLLRREGFPPINIPYGVAQGTYPVNDVSKVDSEAAKPLSDFLLKQPNVDKVTTSSFANYFTVVVQYTESTDAAIRSSELAKLLDQQKSLLPSDANVSLEAVKMGFTMRGDDAVVSFMNTKRDLSIDQLASEARKAAQFFKDQKLDLVKDVSIINPFSTADDANGQTEQIQKSFDRYGERTNGKTAFYDSVVVGFMAQPDADKIKFDNQISKAVQAYNDTHASDGNHAVLSASYAPSIRQQISELQKTLLEGLLAVLIIGSIIIAIRASLITVLSMVTVITTTLGLLFLIGYSLNTITLFALILGLSLIVDDTIIMVEALDAQRRRKKDPNEIVAAATGKVSRAMIAATSTAALSFAPLIFVGGILGGFIRAIPVTIISALVISLFVALIIIPFYARRLLLTKKQLGQKEIHEASAGVEAAIARVIASPMLWAQHSKLKLAGVGIVAVLVSVGFVGAGGFLFSKVTFNIFPAAKDSNQLSISLAFPSGTSMKQAEEVVDRADRKVAAGLGSEFVSASYFGQADVQSANLLVDITDYNKRSITAPTIVDNLKADFKNFEGAQVSIAAQALAGPPPSDFTAQILVDGNRDAPEKLASDVAAYLKTTQLKRLDGSVVAVESVSVASSSVYTRSDGKMYISVTAKFVDTDTTTLVTLAKDAITKEFTTQKVSSYGLPGDSIAFDFGQESENQDSFKTMALAFPVLLLVIYVLLAFQFRSLLQPLLIFLAIPFSLFGITLGLYLTDNAFSFFALLGFFALIGLSLKNTILLTDYANQARRSGSNPVDAAHEALAERFRPLIATSLTAVVSLIPLAVSSPFWEGLTVVLIFGLLSSTVLVILVFPYYYLAGEFLRGIFRRRISQPVKRKFKRA